MSDKVKKQHFVPQFLLRNFADKNEKLWIYEKSTGRSFPSGVANIGCDGYFYDDPEIAAVTGEAQFVEKALSRAEGRWSSTLTAVLERVRSQADVGLSPKERSCISQMIALQMVRTPLAREVNDQMRGAMERALRRSFSQDQDDEKAEISIPKGLSDIDPKNFHIKSMLNHVSIARYQGIFFGHMWNFLRAGQHGRFYTSDHPLSRRPHITGGWMSHSGITSKGIEMSFPLADDVTLLMYDREYFYKMGFMDGKANDALAPEMLLYYNSMQVQESHRFLYSRTSDFEHAETVLKEEPHFRDPNRKVVIDSRDKYYLHY